MIRTMPFGLAQFGLALLTLLVSAPWHTLPFYFFPMGRKSSIRVSMISEMSCLAGNLIPITNSHATRQTH